MRTCTGPYIQPVNKPESARPVVLVADDDADIRLTYRMLLELEGFRVLLAPNAQDALDAIGREKVDVVLTDLFMPGRLDGVDLVHTLCQETPRPVVIAMTGAPDGARNASLHAAAQVGADATLTKPVLPQTLLGTIRTLLHQP